MNVSVIGLGKLGLCTAACFASKGHNVLGMDKSQHFIDELSAHRCPINETGLVKLLDAAWNNFSVSSSADDVVMSSDITLIIVPTPSNPSGNFSNDYVETVLHEIAPAIVRKKKFHVVAVVSTVMPGSCDNQFKPLLEKLTNLTCGTDFGLVYNPEFIALGSIVKNFLNPDMVLIGAYDKHSAELTERLYLSTCENKPYIAMMSLINAEITKISLNCYVTTKISFSNQLAAICEKVPGADIDDITTAMGADSRIGSKYLRGGLGFGGPCFPRDNIAFQCFAKKAGHHATLGTQVVLINNEVVERVVKIICDNTPSHGKVTLLGLSYKPDTHIIEESQSIMIAERLADSGYQCVLHDPQALEEVKGVLGDRVQYVKDPYEGFVNTDAIVLLANLTEYTQLDWLRIASLTHKNALLVDSWRVLKECMPSDFTYRGIGIGATSNS